MGKRARTTPTRQTTINDIARAAGVSKATVSRVLNSVETVNEDLAERVRRVITDLGYTPSQTARSLSLGVSRTVGVVVPDLGNPMFHQVLNGFNRAAANDGYHVVVADSFEDPERESVLAQDLRDRTDAVALFSPRMTRAALLELLPRIAPVAVFNRTTGKNAGSVRIDYHAGTIMIARHLIELGHRRIVFLAGPADARSNWEREKGLVEIRQAQPDADIIDVACGYSFEDGYRAWPAVRDTGATAVIAFNDVVALGLLGRLAEEKVSVPDDLSVAGFDDIPFSRYSSPSLTTMTARLADIGEQIWVVLRSEMTAEPLREPIMFSPGLAVRGSTKELS
ncbi:LacI family DNA-binding transcriptional regulator [Microbacterium sp. Sa4CUA7]|uniref:LacI family DNA-binding transcriptional regulator n=1 Tax=Microbacterium pullorum TaxID=2762236 RepID=A0ABR8RZ43_9MICO|nr:LacI family DNA-binding transcriptional regulator [Microbacterium pullorum]MBD7956500.1 LacI family DNA-binding transcriptional regulator [Microbacterium pullorum]